MAQPDAGAAGAASTGLARWGVSFCAAGCAGASVSRGRGRCAGRTGGVGCAGFGGGGVFVEFGRKEWGAGARESGQVISECGVWNAE